MLVGSTMATEAGSRTEMYFSLTMLTLVNCLMAPASIDLLVNCGKSEIGHADEDVGFIVSAVQAGNRASVGSAALRDPVEYTT